MHPRTISIFFLALLLLTPISSAVAYATPEESVSVDATEKNDLPFAPAPTPAPAAVNPPTQDIIISFQALPSGGSVCRLSTLSPIEVQRFKDGILTPGIIGDEIGSGTNPNKERNKVSDENRIIIPDEEDGSEVGFQREVPTEILSSNEISPILNKHARGSFSFGVVLDDTLRTARRIPDKPNEGWGEAGKLKFRNSSEGFEGVVTNLYSTVVASARDPSSSLTEDEKAYLLAEAETNQLLETEDANVFEAQGLKRVPQNVKLLNHINVDNTFQASMITNCADGKCVLSLYSLFDKYFNAWFSGDLVVSTFGPTLFGQFKKMLKLGKRNNLIPANLADFSAFNPKVSLSKATTTVPSKNFARFSGKSTIAGEVVMRNYKKALQRDVDAGGVFKELFGDKKIFSTGSTAGVEDALFSPTGALGQIKDLETRQKLFSYWGKTKEYSDIYNAYYSQIKTLRGTEKARGLLKLCKDLDDSFNLDCPGVLQKEISQTGFQSLWVKTDAGKFEVLGTTDSKFFTELTENLADQGNFSGVKRLEKLGEDIKIYKLDPSGVEQFVDSTKLTGNLYPPEAYVRLSTFEILPANASSLPLIQADIASGGNPKVIIGGLQDGGVLSPDDFSKRILTGDVFEGKIKNFPINVDSVYDTMVARDWGKGSYTNLLSKQLQQQENIFKNYINILNKDVANSGIGLTAKMYLYWYTTRGGPLGDKFSVYRLPKEFTRAQFIPGEGEFYEDAYVDFFVNEGADDGDLFIKVINELPISYLLSGVSQVHPAVQNFWENTVQHKGRDHPDNVALFMFGSDSCPGCSVGINTIDGDRFTTSYFSPNNYSGYFIEHATRKESIEQGQYLQLFAHRTNIKGQAQGEPLDEINLVKARAEGKTCSQVIKEVPIYGWAAKVIDPRAVGGLIGATENVAYHFLGLGGTFVTVFNQFVAAPVMNECVDDEEGYYASFFVPKTGEEDKPSKSDDLKKAASENVLDGIRSFADSVQAENKSPSFTEKALNEAAGKVKEFVDQQQKNNIAEAQFKITGSSQGNMRSDKPIYFWFEGGSLLETSKYSTKGKTVVSDENGNTVVLDNERGTLTANGQPIIDEASADNVRLSATNLAIPALEIPQRLGAFTFGNDGNALLMNINIRGEALVLDPELLNCIQQAVLDQSGVPLNSNNISEAFGKTNTVVTDAYPSISIDTVRTRIVMEGITSQTASSPSASVQIYGDRHVIVAGTPNPEGGNLNSVLLDYGSLVYKPESNELLIWLRSNAQAVVSDKDVKTIQGNLTEVKNPITSCDEPAIDLRVNTDPNSPLQKLKGDNLTAGLAKNGPFQVFDTDTKTIILYSKLVDGECKPYLKVINKATGEVYEQEIKEIKQNEDGTIQITTADGKTNTLKLSAENGKPVLTYNGQSELLRSASGQGGSFYYDPNKGLYFAENAQFVPLADDFKNRGLSFQANPDGTVSGKASDNIFNINTGQQGSNDLFNIPSLPESLAGMGVVLIVLLSVITAIYLDTRSRKNQ
ncbi:MAG: hypothetical protein IPJ89_03555 [Candidatus Iainarchaeum archaeon]|uniref:Uncharacterized protein n=1 Tax=Candidatus Iainarchaeum sp. TaxID=3101447 RepID=A0A7T9I207_9ARCH|nr:MAG: hypothetical protein IPJ89_03555 [Candidatus Diapherotrites archaeon]